MTPQEAVSAFFNTMRSETDQAGLMYSQFAVVQALDYVIDRWEDLNPLAATRRGTALENGSSTLRRSSAA